MVFCILTTCTTTASVSFQNSSELKKKLVPFSSYHSVPTPASPQQPSICFLALGIDLFCTFLINGIIRYLECVFY